MHADRAQTVAEQHFAALVAALEAGRSDTLAAYLVVASRFHTYSFRNQLLIAAQRPTATRVAGFQTWLSLGRWVRRGEKGIAILAPMTRRRDHVADLAGDMTSDDQAKSTARALIGFRTAFVFDIAQTDGEPLPDIAGTAAGDPGPYLAALEAVIGRAGVTLQRVADLGGALGTSRPGHIAVLGSLSPADAFAVLAHEFAHDQLHQRGERPASKTVRETEAEAVAYIVSAAIGVSASVRAADYIALYDGKAETLRQSLQRIQMTASEILRALQLALSAPTGGL